MYRVRVLFVSGKEMSQSGLSYDEAKNLFKFCIDCILEFGLSVRVVNLMNGKGTVKMFENYRYGKI